MWPRDACDTGGRQDMACPAVVEHERQAFGGILRVKRQIGSAALENTKYRDHKLERAVQRQRNDRLRPRTKITQVTRQLVGPGIELAVAQLMGLEHQRRRSRRAPDLCLEQAGKRPGAVQRMVRRVEHLEHSAALIRIQQVQSANRSIRCRRHR